MIRTQIQIRENQASWLKKKAMDKGISVSQLIRELIDAHRTTEDRIPIEKKKKALAAVGRFSSGKTDISVKHDEFLFQAFGKYEE